MDRQRLGALELIASAEERGFGMDYVRGVALQALAKPERETITEVLRVTIEHGEDDLREFAGSEGPTTIDRRAVCAVGKDGPGVCIRGAWGLVYVSEPYSDVVAWWRGGEKGRTQVVEAAQLQEWKAAASARQLAKERACPAHEWLPYDGGEMCRGCGAVREGGAAGRVEG